MVGFAMKMGLSEEKGNLLLDISIKIAKKILSKPEFSKTKQFSIELTPRLIFSQLGEKYAPEQWNIIEQNFPESGRLEFETIQDPEIKSLMMSFSRAMGSVIKEATEYQLSRVK